MDSLLDFSDKVVLITGASSGFGLLLAKGLHQRGAKLVLGDINMEGLEALAGELGERVAIQHCDVSQEEQCAALVAKALEEFGQLDIAVNNAGVGHEMAAIHEVDARVMERQVAVNLNSVLFGMKHQVPAMLKSGGAILNVSSLAGRLGAPLMSPYVAVKHGVVGLTKSAAVEYARQNIRVNAICPFFSPTNIAKGTLKDEGMEKELVRGCPMKRYGTVEEMVNTMMLILSPGNSFMTGQAIVVDGGVSAI